MLPRTEILNRIEFLMWLIQLKRDNFVCKTNISIKLKWIPSQVCAWRQKNLFNNSEPKAIKYAHKSTFMKGHRRVFLSTLILITAIFEEYSPVFSCLQFLEHSFHFSEVAGKIWRKVLKTEQNVIQRQLIFTA